MSASDTHQSFGRIRRARRQAMPARHAIDLLAGGKARAGSLLAHGAGKSYGDSCHNDEGLLAVTPGSQDRILALDLGAGTLEAESGATLGEIIAYAARYGWFLPVTPGTRFVTLGGAIANDVHGKNHHLRGSFGHHVESLVLARSDGTVTRCSATENAALFRATIGGMGLTGLIVSARIRLMKVASLDVVQEVKPFASLHEFFALDAQSAGNEYSVAWIDQLAGGKAAGRGVLLTGNHSANGNLDGTERAPRLTVPFQPPLTVLNRPFLKAFNTAYRLAQLRKAGRAEVAGWRSFFYPLDAIGHWNRLYGPRGLFQHQSVIPVDAAPRILPDLLQAARDAGQGSFLTVLKRFGDMESAGLLSFARPGYTLTLDFPNRGQATLDLLDRLDAITTGAGGAVNPYKDARMSAATFEASFPDWQRLDAFRDPAFCSDFWRRTALALPQADPLREAAP